MLTILTDSIPTLFRTLRYKMRLFMGKPPLPKYGGHFAVTRSLVEGLQKIGVDFNYNPTRLEDIGESVIVLAGLRALKQAIQWKRQGRIKRLLAGPNLVVLPSDNRALITAKEIDLYLINSDWTYNLYLEDAPELLGKIAIWPAGVDTTYWKPPTTKPIKNILIYQKNGPLHLIEQCESAVKHKGYQLTTVVYGAYTQDAFLEKLQKSSLAIFFSPSESQGIALVEAWSVNVPTLVWNQTYTYYSNKKLQTSSAPYLSRYTGLFFSSLSEFETTLASWEDNSAQFSPRHWVLENMSDELSARYLCSLAGVPL